VLDSHLCHILLNRCINWHEPFVPHIFSLSTDTNCVVHISSLRSQLFLNCVAFLWFNQFVFKLITLCSFVHFIQKGIGVLPRRSATTHTYVKHSLISYSSTRVFLPISVHGFSHPQPPFLHWASLSVSSLPMIGD
jgi:hypothetical protein